MVLGIREVRKRFNRQENHIEFVRRGGFEKAGDYRFREFSISRAER
jgi:hypothetical protein